MIPTILLVALSCAVVMAQRSSPCVSCQTPNVTSFFDGCNTCSCSSPSAPAACTKRACLAPNDDPTVCTDKCDGFRVPSDDGCGTCACKNGRVDLNSCTLPVTTRPCDSCSAVTCPSGKRCVPSPKQCITTPCPQFECVADDGAFKCGCNGAVCKSGQGCATNGTCVALPTQNWFADGAPFCVRGGGGRCCGDNFGASCGATDSCINGQCIAASRVDAACSTGGQCYNCQTPGVKSYFDGCNRCSCDSTTGRGSCTELACATVVPDPKKCNAQCDGFVTDDDGACGRCTCIDGQKTQCSKCGVGSACRTDASGRSQCSAVVPPKACDSKPCAFGETCVEDPKQCFTTPCPQYRCEKPKACDAKPCDSDEVCVEEPKQCVTTPCPQYRCDKVDSNTCFNCKTLGVKSYFDGCNQCSCSSSGVATCTKLFCAALFRDPKQCGGHCDGFLTEDDGACGRCTCIGGEKTKCSKCGVGSGCRTDANGRSQCSAVVLPKACDAKPCAADETCSEDPKQCFTTPCPQYRCDKIDSNTCFDCKTPNVKSYFDGCNQCTCSSTGEAACTELACDTSIPDPKQCRGQCDGFVTADDGACGQCTCIGGKKAKCSKCGIGSSCTTDDNGKSQCSAVVPKPCDTKPCAAGETCIEDPKQCFTTPCPQYRCEKSSNTKCVVCNSDAICKDAVVPKGDACNTCKCVDGKQVQCTSRRCSRYCKDVTQCSSRGLICVADPKNCVTTPCDQFACVEIGSDAARQDELVDHDDVPDGASMLSASAVAVVIVTMFTMF
jgi:hypothetical protein